MISNNSLFVTSNHEGVLVQVVSQSFLEQNSRRNSITAVVRTKCINGQMSCKKAAIRVERACQARTFTSGTVKRSSNRRFTTPCGPDTQALGQKGFIACLIRCLNHSEYPTYVMLIQKPMNLREREKVHLEAG